MSIPRRLPSVFVLAGTLAPVARPQDPPATPPVVVTASRTAQDPFAAPWAADVIDERQLQARGYRTTPQALREVPSVLVQETSPGQGSPFIRGFTGYLNLFLIDGVRLNNSVFRSGPNQYWNTVDPLSLARLEVVKGPASTLYGSDAVGGTVQAFTRSPYAFGEDRLAWGGSSYLRYGTADDALFGRLELSVGQIWAGGSRTGVLVGGDAKAFGDLEGGRSTGEQHNTGYDETAVDVKLEHWTDANTRWVFLHQRLAQDAVPRTHATVFGQSYAGTSVGTDRQRNLDQERSLTYLQYHRDAMAGPVQALHASLSWHQQSEDQDRIRSNHAQEVTGFDVGTLGAWLQLESSTDVGALAYGIEYYRDHVDSSFRRSGAPQPGDGIQGSVADDATYDLLGVYLQDALPLGERVELTLGGRYTYAAADADRVRDPSTNLPIALSDHWDQFTGSARLRVDLLPSHWNVYGGVSQGFRAPNLSDLTSFETARSGEAEVPAPGLEPEEYLGYELGTKVRTADVTVQAAWYWTDIDDQILRFPTGTTNAAGQPVVTKANVGDGYIQGAEVAAAWRCWQQTTVFGAFAWQYGRVTNFNSGGSSRSEEFTTRLLPPSSRLGVRWEDAEGRWWAETEVVRAEDADKLSSGDVRDTQRIPPGGTPGYTLWHLRAGVELSDAATLFVALENVTDVDYRVHGSGSNSPGSSLVLGFRSTF